MAAAAKATATEPAPARGGSSMVVQLGLLVGLTAAAAGMGWVSGGMLEGGAKGGVETAAAAPAAGHAANEPEAKGGSDDKAASQTVIPLPAITTNIAAPGDVWVRMEVSLVLDEPQPAELPGDVLQDLLAYVRTVKLHEIEGASGFRHFRENLEERASVRSDGHVKQVLIRTLLFE